MADVPIRIDYDAWARAIREGVPAAFDEACMRTVNDAAFGAARLLRAEVDAKVDRPVPFTDRAWAVAKARRGSEPEAVVSAKELQAAYLRYVISGGVRHAETDHSPRRWIYAPAKGGRKPDRYGGVPKSLPRRLGREAFDTPGSRIFFGTIRATTGFWMRPLRTDAARAEDGQVVRRKGVVSVRPRGGPKLLLQAREENVYTKRLVEYDRVVTQAGAEAAAGFADHLRRAMERRRGA